MSQFANILERAIQAARESKLDFCVIEIDEAEVIAKEMVRLTQLEASQSYKLDFLTVEIHKEITRLTQLEALTTSETEHATG